VLWDEALTGQIYLGSEAFAKRMQRRAEALDARQATDIPRPQRQPMTHPIEWYLRRHGRDAAIVAAYVEGGHTQTAIAAAVGLSVSRVSRVIARHEAAEEK
jgi:putative transposase